MLSDELRELAERERAEIDDDARLACDWIRQVSAGAPESQIHMEACVWSVVHQARVALALEAAADDLDRARALLGRAHRVLPCDHGAEAWKLWREIAAYLHGEGKETGDAD